MKRAFGIVEQLIGLALIALATYGVATTAARSTRPAWLTPAVTIWI